MKTRIIFYLLGFSIVVFMACRKSKVSPLCWKEKERATLYYYGRSICGGGGLYGYLILHKNNDTLYFTNKISKKFPTHKKINVLVSYKETNKKQPWTADCDWQNVYYKIICIMEDE